MSIQDITPESSVVPVFLDPSPIIPPDVEFRDEPGPGENATATSDPFVRRAPDGGLWRINISNTGRLTSVRLTAEEALAFEANS